MLYPQEPESIQRAERIAHWERVRAGGRRAFVWRTGVLRGGLPLGMATLFLAFMREVGWQFPAPLPEHLRVPFAVALAFFCGMGWLMGARAWDQGEEQYRKLTRRTR